MSLNYWHFFISTINTEIHNYSFIPGISFMDALHVEYPESMNMWSDLSNSITISPYLKGWLMLTNITPMPIFVHSMNH